MKEISKRTLKIAIAILLIGLISTTYAVYHLWTTRQIGMNAYISTSLNLRIYSDPNCTQELTEIAWGDYGKGEQYKVFYFKNLGNDKGYMTWKMNTTGWTLQQVPYLGSYYYFYGDQHFNFTICGGDQAPGLQYSVNPEGSGETTYIELQPRTIGHLWMRCWTDATLAYNSTWTVFFNFYDNL